METKGKYGFWFAAVGAFAVGTVVVMANAYILSLTIFSQIEPGLSKPSTFEMFRVFMLGSALYPPLWLVGLWIINSWMTARDNTNIEYYLFAATMGPCFLFLPVLIFRDAYIGITYVAILVPASVAATWVWWRLHVKPMLAAQSKDLE